MSDGFVIVLNSYYTLIAATVVLLVGRFLVQRVRVLNNFIEERRADSVHRIGKGIDVAPYLEFEHTKAFIRDQNGGGEWFIYARNFQILEKKSKLEVCELEYPIGSGMKARESFELIDKKWTPRILVHPEERGQFPRNSANKSRQRTC